jgi:hypothetical protein
MGMLPQRPNSHITSCCSSSSTIMIITATTSYTIIIRPAIRADKRAPSVHLGGVVNVHGEAIHRDDAVHGGVLLQHHHGRSGLSDDGNDDDVDDDDDMMMTMTMMMMMMMMMMADDHGLIDDHAEQDTYPWHDAVPVLAPVPPHRRRCVQPRAVFLWHGSEQEV